MLVKTFGAAVHGIDAMVVTIEVSMEERGWNFTIVGLPDTAVKESSERIHTALRESGMNLPRRAVVVNMAPADIKKEGAAFDLPIAVGLLSASEVIKPVELESYMIMGELSLDGRVRPVRGVLPMAIEARRTGFRSMIVPEENATEAAVVNDITVYGVQNIQQVVEIVQGLPSVAPTVVDTRAEFAAAQQSFDFDFSEVKGQENVKRAFEVACAGGHNILLVGPPGSGKSMMAKRLPSILPPLTLREALETTKIHSVAGSLKRGSRLLTHRPFRAPHHTVSPVALVGGGTNPRPGEISLAHNGVLFLDELPEFSRSVLEVMRQPLEDRQITVARAKYNVEYPASFMLVASMNPCPCGYYNHPTKPCSCPPGAVTRYLGKISGPLLDRIDLQIEILPVPFEKLADSAPGESSESIRERVVKARAIQGARFAGEAHIHCNAQMNSRLLQRWCVLSKDCSDILQHAMVKFDMSARAYDRILKVARTIADLDNSEDIQPRHMSEAVGYRNLDRAGWGSSSSPR